MNHRFRGKFFQEWQRDFSKTNILTPSNSTIWYADNGDIILKLYFYVLTIYSIYIYKTIIILLEILFNKSLIYFITYK